VQLTRGSAGRDQYDVEDQTASRLPQPSISVGRLTSGELDRTQAAADLLIQLAREHGVLDPLVTGKLGALLEDCRTEAARRTQSAHRSRLNAIARRQATGYPA
jgi:hypothetical protein